MVNNQHLVEVLCAIRFNPSENEWDSTYFGKYHDLIEKKGYIDKKEQKEVEFQLQVNPSLNQSVFKDGQTRMVFSNPQMKSAIIMAAHFISFHKLVPYDSWNVLMRDIVVPRLSDYYNIGLGKGLTEVQCLYLNKYSIGKDESVTKYFNFLPIIKGSIETQVVFNGRYEIDPFNIVQLKLHTTGNKESGRDAFFECSSFVTTNQSNEEFLVLAQKAHDNTNNAYRAIIKE